jgi:hypothetical protein
LPYANASAGGDPGIAVYWIERGNERVIACDRWNHVDLNMRAIDMSLVAMRGLDRWGAAEMVERAFAGFALPAGPGPTTARPPAKRPWREVLGGIWPTALDAETTLEIAKGRYRVAIKAAHPDVGGDVAIAAALNVAMAEAESELAP